MWLLELFSLSSSVLSVMGTSIYFILLLCIPTFILKQLQHDLSAKESVQTKPLTKNDHLVPEHQRSSTASSSIKSIDSVSSENTLNSTSSPPQQPSQIHAFEGDETPEASQTLMRISSHSDCSAILNYAQSGRTDMPTSIGQEIVDVRLDRNLIKSISVSLQHHHLQILDLSWNLLESLPVEIKHLTRLRHLSLSGNKLSSLPGEVGQLLRLEVLAVASNALESIPSALKTCERLKVLDISANKLKSLPCEIGWIKSLVTLHTTGNPWNQPFSDLFSISTAKRRKSRLVSNAKSFPTKIDGSAGVDVHTAGAFLSTAPTSPPTRSSKLPPSSPHHLNFSNIFHSSPTSPPPPSFEANHDQPSRVLSPSSPSTSHTEELPDPLFPIEAASPLSPLESYTPTQDLREILRYLRDLFDLDPQNRENVELVREMALAPQIEDDLNAASRDISTPTTPISVAPPSGSFTLTFD